MGAPVLIDDGGSVRIKLAKKDPDVAGAMDSLFDVKEKHTVANPNRKGSEHEISDNRDPYQKALVLWLDKDGALPANVTPVLFNSIQITCDFGQNILLTTSGGGSKLSIEVFSDLTDPIIESKQHFKKRSYNIVNAGRIRQVNVDNGSTVYDIPDNAIYASLVVT